MDPKEAARRVAEIDARDNESRGERLAELNGLLPDDLIGFSGQAAEWLFDDVKATWIYGYFTATVLAARALCLQQLAGLIRMQPDDPSLPDSIGSLDQLSALAEERRVIDLDLRARLLTLDDVGRMYASVDLHEYDAQVERRAQEAERFAEEHSLLTDARAALECSVALLHRRA